MTVNPFTRKTDFVDTVRAQDINELQIACEDLQSQMLSHAHSASDITSGILSTDRFSAWNDLIAEGKILQATRTIYLSPTGSDSNGNGSQSKPYFTINRALQDLQGVWLNGQNVVIQLANGTYNWMTRQNLVNLLGGISIGQCRITGNTSSPSSVTIIHTGGQDFAIQVQGIQTPWYLEGFTIQGNVTQSLIESSNGSRVYFKDLVFGASNSRHLSANNGSILADGNYSITGGGTTHIGIYNFGYVFIYQRTVTLSGTPSFSTAFLHMSSGSGCNLRFTVWSGSATGTRYNLDLLCWANTNGATLPGSVAGVVTNGSYYI